MDLFEFAHEMMAKLEENTHKTGWGVLTPGQLLQRLRQETNELERAIARGILVDVIREAADVANFAYFIADNATEPEWLQEEERRGRRRGIPATGRSDRADEQRGNPHAG